MKTNLNTKLLSMLLAILMLFPTFTHVIPVFAEDITTYVLDASNLPDVSANTKEDGDTDTVGTKSFFTLHYKAATRIESTANVFDGKGQDGFAPSKRINLQGTMTITEGIAAGAVSFMTQGSAEVKIWWGCGEVGRQMSIIDGEGNTIVSTDEAAEKNGLYISTLTLDKEGTYYLGGLEGSNYIYKIAVKTKTLDLGPRAEWSTISAPKIESCETNEEGKIQLNVNALVGHNGADNLVVNMYQDGKIISTAKSTSYKSAHKLTFAPVETGSYSFEAIISREGEESKVGATYDYKYTLPLAVPYVTNCANLGNKTVNVIWNAVKEADSYNVYVNDELYCNTTERNCVITGLESGSTPIIHIESVRGNEKSSKYETSIKVGAKKTAWNFTIYGPSAKTGSNEYLVNKDGSVTVSSLNGSGKIQPTGADGLGFYYTVVPTDQNFTFRATIKVNNWTYSNGQEGFGLMVTDHVPSSDYTADDFWTNQYMAVATKIEYWYSTDEEGNYYLSTSDQKIGTKYSMKLGIGSISKTGIDQSIIDRTALGETGLIVGQNGALKSVVHTLERQAGFFNEEAGTYNLIGNWKNAEGVEGSFDEENLVTTLTLEIKKNNTGYFITYYDKNGNVVRTIKNYEPDALSQFDSEYVYVGMFAARNANVTFSDIELTTIDPAKDDPAEERPIEPITPTITVTSATYMSSTDYQLFADTNLDGTITVKVNNKVVLADQPVKKDVRFTQTFDLSEIIRLGENDILVTFKADPDQEMEPYTEIATLSADPYEATLTYFKASYHTKNVYVSPDGFYNGNGTKENPYDIYTAVNIVIPGQTIILMEGTYKLKTGLTIQRGINGTEENPIRMIADPEAETRPVIDFMGMGTGILHGGNWWHFYGFDVTNSLDGQKGFQISGNNNIVEQVHTYHNGNTGIQLSRYHGVDLTIDQWPANNLILNCTSYGNADTGYEDADGFAAKLTIGEGNVFDGCIAYNNADDGWDLYAKVATGEIGAVVIKNCVAYGNGYLEDGTNAGNGNGFKLGGDSLPGQHQLINCIAFNNKAKGIDSNSCPDIIVKNCISYNNGSHNVALYTNTANDTEFNAEGIISFKDDKVGEDAFKVNESFKPKGNQDVEAYTGASNYYWQGGNCVNSAGDTLTADIFVSTEFKGITRNEDGTINMNGFLELSDKAPANSGTTGESTPSNVIELEEDIEHTPGDWTSDDWYVHWQECECGFRANVEEHTFEYVTDKEPTITKPGSKHNECTVCGYKRPPIEIPALGGTCPGHVDENTDYICDMCDEELERPMPNIFEDFFGFWTWIFDWISKFFASLFGGAG